MQKRSFTAGGFSPDRGKREEMACAVRANPAEPGRWGGRTRRQNGAVRWTAGQSAEQGGKTERQEGAVRWTAGRDGRTERQNRAARQSGRKGQEGAVRWTAGQSGRTGRRTRRQNRAAGRSGKTEQQDGAARRSGKTERQKKRGRAKPGHRSGQVRGRRPHKQKNGIPTAGSRRTAKKRTEKQPGICKRPTHRFSIRCSDTGKGAILSARPPLVK